MPWAREGCGETKAAARTAATAERLQAMRKREVVRNVTNMLVLSLLKLGGRRAGSAWIGGPDESDEPFGEREDA